MICLVFYEIIKKENEVHHMPMINDSVERKICQHKWWFNGLQPKVSIPTFDWILLLLEPTVKAQLILPFAEVHHWVIWISSWVIPACSYRYRLAQEPIGLPGVRSIKGTWSDPTAKCWNWGVFSWINFFPHNMYIHSI